MRIFLNPNTVGRYGGALHGHLGLLYHLIQSELKKADFKSSFDQLWLTLSYPPMYVLPGVVDLKIMFDSHYQTLPYSRIGRKTKKIEITLQAPEFSEHMDKDEAKNYGNRFDIASEYQNLTDVDLAKILIDKFIESGKIITSKLKKEDEFDIEIYNKVLLNIKAKISSESLASIHAEQVDKVIEGALKKAIAMRDKRKSEVNPQDKLIRDIRMYFNGLDVMADHEFAIKIAVSSNKYSELFLSKLRERKFHCPKYHHLYIQVSKTMDDALRNSINYESWYINGIAIVDYNNLAKQPSDEQERTLFNLMLTGLKDIATIDKLDMNAIDNVASEIKQTELALKNAL